ncbi:MAG: prenyltransferase/squalene oxidase repeat-containing protein [Armatimonadota bacterium]
MGYLDLLDVALRPGAEALSEDFAALQVAWIEARQRPDGGFAGRAGGSDLYYTDFALRALDLLAPESSAFAAAADFLRSQAPPADVVGAFSALSCARLLARHGHPVDLERPLLAAVVARQARLEGGFAAPGTAELSAYASFLGTLCREMLGEPTDLKRSARAVCALRCDDGGFGEREEQPRAQTNATAAAVALLAMAGALTEGEARAAGGFLAAMQGPDGGLRAHAEAPAGDLLSTFTGLLTLTMVGGVEALDLPALGRFVRATARAEGGFAASAADPGADVEYAYYGIGTLALLRSMMARER